MRAIATRGRALASKTDSFAPLSALLVAALCLPAALLVGSGATAELLDAATLTRLTENRDRPVLFCLTVLHIVSGAMLAFAFATASHEARRIRDGTSDAVVSPTAQVRNRKSSVMRILTRDNRLAPAEVRDLQSGPVIGAFTSRRAAVPSMESPIVNEMALASFLSGGNVQKSVAASLPFVHGHGGVSHRAGATSPSCGSGARFMSMDSTGGAFVQRSTTQKLPNHGEPDLHGSSLTALSPLQANPSACIGAGLTDASPFMSSPCSCSSPAQNSASSRVAFSSPLSQGLGSSKRRLGGVDGSGSKYQRALYIPSSSDTQEDPNVISRRASDLLAQLAIIDVAADGANVMPTWRDNLRKWMAHTVFQPLAALFELNERLVAEAAASGASTAAPGQSPSLFAAGSTAPMPSEQWLLQQHSDMRFKALVQQHTKLQRFVSVPRFASPIAQRYARARIAELASGHCLSCFQWNSGGADWDSSLPMDVELLLHVFATFFDTILPAMNTISSTPSVAPRSIGGACGVPQAGMGTFGAFTSPSACCGISSTAHPGVARDSLFWRPTSGLHTFSSEHVARTSDTHRVKSDAVIVVHLGNGATTLDQPGSNPSAPPRGGHDVSSIRNSTLKRAAPRVSLLCDGVEWVVAQGEHNVWEAIVLFIFQRAKRGGFVGGLDLSEGLLQPFVDSLTTNRTDYVSNSATKDVLLVTLYPWSQRLEDVDLDEVTQALSSR